MALTIEQFTDMANSQNLQCIMNNDVITGSGNVDESMEQVLCGGAELYEYIWECTEFEGEFKHEDVFASIVMMRSVN